MDSGIGGLPYCRRFFSRPHAPSVVYLADRAHFPYGTKTKGDLIRILGDHVEHLSAFCSPVLAVLACNTASVSALAELRERFPVIPFVGTVPAVKPAVEESLRRSVGILGTERTLADPSIGDLASRYGPDCAVHKRAAPELVDFVERRLAAASGEERLRVAGTYIERFRSLGVDAVVLGCTHFLFLVDEFRAAGASGGCAVKIYDSLEGVCARAEALLAEIRPSPRPPVPVGGDGDSVPRRLLLLSGEEPPGPLWEARAREYGMTLGLLPVWRAGTP
jgi:glutamate racemase